MSQVPLDEAVTVLIEGWIRHRSRLIVGLFAIASALAVLPAASVRIDSSVGNMMTRDDPDLEKNQLIKVEFSNDEILAVAIDFGRPFEASDLRLLSALSERIAEIASTNAHMWNRPA